ncbi:MAG TPA: prolyl oligopeptidase family serine peptidase [Gemmatimonadaceae bacterium]|nr:prolyl oligopeptidase family serine peptidase [Gemmatimonadaceae bacterium]
MILCAAAFAFAVAPLAFAVAPLTAQSTTPFTLEQVKSAPFPNALAAAATGDHIVWAFNDQGKRNLWVAEGPAFQARQLTQYNEDLGQDFSSVQVSPDGRWVVYIRGGDFGSNWDDASPVNPVGATTPVSVEMWAVPFAGGEPVSLGTGGSPIIAPSSDRVIFQRDRQLWSIPIDGSGSATRLFTMRGSNGQAQFSPDGSRIAFVSSRGDHAFIGIYTDSATPIQWIAPSTNRDWSPRWSPDGTQLVFARRSGSGGEPGSLLEFNPSPWSLWIADVATGTASERWASDTTLVASVPSTQGGVNLHWAAKDRIVFMSYHDGQPHLYSMTAAGSDRPMLLTPGEHMAEYVTLSPDGTHLVYAGNTGDTPGDLNRRHIVRVPVDRAAPEVVTPGTGLEWTPFVLGSGRIAAIGATAQRPPLPMIIEAGSDTKRWIGEALVPANFPTSMLVTPKPVTYQSEDGLTVHAQLFEPPAGGPAKKAAVIYVHGGPPRQMLLGWHYSDYYANAYAMNQYLASRGFVVLAINYRLGIGYGHDFHRPPEAGIRGASEYRDVKAAAVYLGGLPQVDPARIGIYGGSYGGYLTALALGRDSKLFATGVDIHGVHDFTSDGGGRFGADQWRYEISDEEMQKAAEVAWNSSPVSAVDTWTSPVLFIHADDDRNVQFSQTVDLVQRLKARGIEYEEIVIPDDTHHWMRFANQMRVNHATAEYLERKLKPLGRK